MYAFADLVAYHLWHSLSRDDAYRVVKINDIDGITEDRAYFFPRGFDEVTQSPLKDVDGRSIWIAFRSAKLDRNEPPLRNFIVGGYEIKETRVFQSEVQNAYLVLLERR